MNNCEICKGMYTVGNFYDLDLIIICDSCGVANKVFKHRMIYIGMDNIEHRFSCIFNPVVCLGCKLSISLIRFPCGDYKLENIGLFDKIKINESIN